MPEKKKSTKEGKEITDLLEAVAGKIKTLTEEEQNHPYLLLVSLVISAGRAIEKGRLDNYGLLLHQVVCNFTIFQRAVEDLKEEEKKA